MRRHVSPAMSAGPPIMQGGTASACAPLPLPAGTMWSYNQGVLLGGLIQLASALNDPSLIDTAKRIADAALSTLVDEDGVLVEHCEPECTADGSQFKGIFVRYLARLYRVTKEVSSTGWRPVSRVGCTRAKVAPC